MRNRDFGPSEIVGALPATAAAALLVLFAIVLIKTAWLGDDAFITLRTVRNSVDGYGLVWNVGERVQAYTHPLWLAALSAVYFATREAFYSALLLSAVLTLAALWLVVRRLAAGWTVAVLAVLVLSLSKAFTDYSTSGLENPLTHLLIALFAAVYVQRRPSVRTLTLLALITALASLARMDAVLFFLPALAVGLVQLRSWRALGGLLLGFTPLAAWLVFATFYYGFPFPNTAYAKLDAWIPAANLVGQGLLYLLESLGTDPITLAAIGLALALPLLSRRWELLPLAAGIALYLAYVVRIGGDFMSGRFLSGPLLLAVIVLARKPLPARPRWATAATFGAVLLVGLMNPAQSPWLSPVQYARPEIDSRGIADERGGYHPWHGLLSANRSNRLYQSGTLQGTADPRNFVHCGIGYQGFTASPYTHIVDNCGLADALLARLPPVHNPTWRVGHLARHVPAGYLAGLRLGENKLLDRELAVYYDKLRIVIQGDLWNLARLGEIWRLNTGAYDGLIDAERYRFPDIQTVGVPALDPGGLRNAAVQIEDSGPLSLGPQGVRLELAKKATASLLDLGFDGDLFEVVYFDDGTPVARQVVKQPPLRLGGEMFNVVTVPAEAAGQGYTALRVTPLTGAALTFTGATFLQANAEGAATPSGADLAELLRLYYFTFYRQTGGARQTQLDGLRQAIAQADLAAWAEIPPAVLVDLLEMPDPAIHALIEPNLRDSVVLADAAGQPVLRYLGAGQPTFTPYEDEVAAQMNLYFQVLSSPARDYSAWFHIKRPKPGEVDSYDQWMVYDEFPEPPTTAWGEGTLARFAPTIRLAPGEYEIAYGFWTPGDRERLYVAGSEDYWINLGTITVESPDEP